MGRIGRVGRQAVCAWAYERDVGSRPLAANASLRGQLQAFAARGADYRRHLLDLSVLRDLSVPLDPSVPPDLSAARVHLQVGILPERSQRHERSAAGQLQSLFGAAIVALLPPRRDEVLQLVF